MKFWILLGSAALVSAQTFTQRGFLDIGAVGYPQTSAVDSGQITADALFRYEAFYQIAPWLRLSGGVDARIDTHQQVARDARFSFGDREVQRPALELRGLSLAFTRSKLSIELGKQFIRWGRADIVSPEDRFAPQDYMNVVDAEPLPILATRVTYGTQANSLELVYSPRLTPSRTPLLDQRWAFVPTGLSINEVSPDIPGGPQWGARWNHSGRADYSVSYYRGYDYFPLLRVEPEFPMLNVQRLYPQLSMYSADAAIPSTWVTLKAEAAYFTSSNPQSDHYVIYVLQLERQIGEWSLIGGYAEQVVTEHGTGADFSVLRGFSRSMVGQVSYSIDANRSFDVEAAIRQDGRGTLVKPEYSQAFGQHWRATVGFAWIQGSENDFIGQYHRNSFAILRIRYSF